MAGPTGCVPFISIVDSQERAKGRRTHGMVSAVAVAAVEGIELTYAHCYAYRNTITILCQDNRDDVMMQLELHPHARRSHYSRRHGGALTSRAVAGPRSTRTSQLRQCSVVCCAWASAGR